MRAMQCFFLSMIVAGWLLCSGGCQLDSAQRLAVLESVVTQAQAAVQAASASVTILQEQLSSLQAAGASSETLAAVQRALDLALQSKADVDAFLTKAQADVTKAKENPTIGGEIEAYGSIAFGVLGVALSAWFKRKLNVADAQARAGQNAYEDLLDQRSQLAEDHSTARETLKLVTRAVESLPDDQQKTVKALIAAQMVKRSPHNGVIDEAKAA